MRDRAPSPTLLKSQNFKEFLQGGTLLGSRAEVFMLFGAWKDEARLATT